LGWYYVAMGRMTEARKMLGWMESTASEFGDLPEQIPSTLNDPGSYQPWFDRWGKIASPLLWSHANYLILDQKIKP